MNENDENYRLILDSTTEGIFKLDLDGICTFCNRACYQMLGYDQPTDLLGQAIHTLIQHTRADGSPYPATESLIHQAFIRNKKTHLDTEVLFRKNGSSFPVEYWSQPINRKGKTTGCLVTFRDISQRKQTEENQLKSHALYSQAEQMGKMGHWEWDHKEYKMISCSKQFAQIYQMSVDEAIAYFSSQDQELAVVHPEDRGRFKRALADCAAQRNTLDIQYRLLLPSGDLRYVHERSEHVLDEEGRTIKSFGTVQDITERMPAEQALRESHALYGQAEQMGKLGHWEWNAETDNLIACSEQYAKIFEMTVEQVLTTENSFDEEVEEYIHEDDRLRYLQLVNDAYEQKVAWDIEYRCYTRTGKIVYLRELGEPVFDDHGELVRSFGTLQDITESKQAEAALQSSESRYRALYDNNPIMLFTIDQSGKVLSVNQFGIDQLGYSKNGYIRVSQNVELI